MTEGLKLVPSSCSGAWEEDGGYTQCPPTLGSLWKRDLPGTRGSEHLFMILSSANKRNPDRYLLHLLGWPVREHFNISSLILRADQWTLIKTLKRTAITHFCDLPLGFWKYRPIVLLRIELSAALPKPVQYRKLSMGSWGRSCLSFIERHKTANLIDEIKM